jgi:hypothetical protein
MQRRMMTMVAALVMALSMVVGPGAASAAGRQTGGVKPMSFGPTSYYCHITGENGYQLCPKTGGGTYTVYPNEQVVVCLTSTTHGDPGGFLLLDKNGTQRGSARTIQPGGCAVLWFNNTGNTISVNLYIDSQSYSWDQYFSGTISSQR